MLDQGLRGIVSASPVTTCTVGSVGKPKQIVKGGMIGGERINTILRKMPGLPAEDDKELSKTSNNTYYSAGVKIKMNTNAEKTNEMGIMEKMFLRRKELKAQLEKDARLEKRRRF